MPASYSVSESPLSGGRITQRSPRSQAPWSPKKPPQLSLRCRAHMKQQPQMSSTTPPGQFLGSSHLDSSQGRQTKPRAPGSPCSSSSARGRSRRRRHPPAAAALARGPPPTPRRRRPAENAARYIPARAHSQPGPGSGGGGSSSPPPLLPRLRPLEKSFLPAAAEAAPAKLLPAPGFPFPVREQRRRRRRQHHLLRPLLLLLLLLLTLARASSLRPNTRSEAFPSTAELELKRAGGRAATQLL